MYNDIINCFKVIRCACALYISFSFFKGTVSRDVQGSFAQNSHCFIIYFHLSNLARSSFKHIYIMSSCFHRKSTKNLPASLQSLWYSCFHKVNFNNTITIDCAYKMSNLFVDMSMYIIVVTDTLRVCRHSVHNSHSST